MLMCRVRSLLNALVSPRLSGSWAEGWIEDVVQEALLDVLRGYRSCRASSETAARSWVRTIGRREIAQLCRHEAERSRHTVSLTDHIYAPAASSLGPMPLEDSTVLSRLRKVLDQAGPDESRLLWARFQISASWAEVGQELGIAPTAAKRR